MTYSRFKLLTMTAAASLAVVSCTSESVQDAPSTDEIKFTSRVSRATETTLDALKSSDGFKVFADVDDWSNLLINGEVAKWDATKSAFVLNKNYNWSSDMKSIQFWAVHPIDEAIVKPHISASEIYIDQFTPVASLNNPGASQSDLIIAYTKATYNNVPNNAVPLTFQHALAQIEVNIKNNEEGTDGRKVVKIAGACIVNVKNKGNLGFQPNDNDATAADPSRFTIADPNGAYDIVWNTTSAANASYGMAFPGNLGLNLMPGQVNAAISNSNRSNSSLMLIPQVTKAYDFNNADAAGSYILLLCRVEIHHPGNTHTSPDGSNESVGSDGKGGHIHQLFPKLVDNTYNANAYGYTCVPVSFDWKPGLRHIYTLHFLGANAGAGQYPPTNHPVITPPEGIDVVPTPDDKKPGDMVLDNPITFNVSVTAWKNASDEPVPTPMP